MMKGIFVRLFCILMASGILWNCNSTSSNDDPTFYLNTATLFPFQGSGNWWKYSDTSGHTLSDSVVLTFTDNATTYFKMVVNEKGIDTSDNWLRRSSVGTEYSTSIAGPYSILLPPSFDSKQGSFTSSSGNTVTYSYSDSMLVKGKYRNRVMALTFPQRNIHGFDEIDFADSLGIIRFVDNSGRFPVIYSLDSAKINGVIRR